MLARAAAVPNCDTLFAFVNVLSVCQCVNQDVGCELGTYNLQVQYTWLNVEQLCALAEYVVTVYDWNARSFITLSIRRDAG